MYFVVNLTLILDKIRAWIIIFATLTSVIKAHSLKNKIWNAIYKCSVLFLNWEYVSIEYSIMCDKWGRAGQKYWKKKCDIISPCTDSDCPKPLCNNSSKSINICETDFDATKAPWSACSVHARKIHGLESPIINLLQFFKHLISRENFFPLQRQIKTAKMDRAIIYPQRLKSDSSHYKWALILRRCPHLP